MRWDIFCQIIDNYGDAGICWRLARSLANQHHQNIRLFCDDLQTLQLLMIGKADTQRIEVLPWAASAENARDLMNPPNVVIQAFSCNLPKHYLSCLLIAHPKPIVIHLEYLSAEPWIADFHGKPSPQNHGLQKYFFFPGFQANSGGLLLDPIPQDLLGPCPASLLPIWAQCRAGAKKISIFSYPGAPIKSWLEGLNQREEAFDVLLAFGNAQLLNLQQHAWKHLNLISMPFIPQDDYDYLLSQCELNIVRGEDSFIRAQLAGKPFIWNIYPQEDGAHEVKLRAFLDLYLKEASPELKLLIKASMAWDPSHQWLSHRDQWQKHAIQWRAKLLNEQSDGGLASRLLQFVS